jgi:hypothetical protein
MGHGTPSVSAICDLRKIFAPICDTRFLAESAQKRFKVNVKVNSLHAENFPQIIFRNWTGHMCTHEGKQGGKKGTVF